MPVEATAPSRRLKAWTRHLFHRRTRPTQDLYDEILYLSSRTQSLDALLTQYPERICAALGLQTFHILLHEGASYLLQPGGATSLPASCSTVSRMRRDRNPALFARPDDPQAEPEAWQLLAEPYELTLLNELGAQILLPLQGRTGLMGFVALSRPGLEPFTSAELRFLGDLGPEMGRGLETAQMVQRISRQAVEQARATRELELAREVQSHLLPGQLPAVPGLQAAASYRSAEQVGGDYYDLFPTPSGQLCLVVADVSGKGVPAALLMASLRASVHALMLDPGIPITVLAERLNQLLYAASSASRYATLLLCLYDPATGELLSLNAGHNPPMLLRASGALERLTAGGTVAGLLPGVAYGSETRTLQPGDLLLAYTDGVSEAMNAQAEEWGEWRLERALRDAVAAYTGDEPTAILDALLRQLDTFRNHHPQSDDITLLLIKRVS